MNPYVTNNQRIQKQDINTQEKNGEMEMKFGECHWSKLIRLKQILKLMVVKGVVVDPRIK